MNLDSIKEKVSEIFNSTPPEIGFGFGFKIKDNVLTDEVGFTYIVPKKKSVEELSGDEIFPKTIIHDGVEYSTDVVEIPEVVPFGQFCYGNDPIGGTQIPINCFSFTASTTVLNRNYTRPLKGGISLGPPDAIQPCTPTGTLTTQPGSGTLGFIAVDNDTNALVGVTNNHVVITGLNDAFFTGDRNLFSTAIYNEAFPLRSVRQPGGSDGFFIQPYEIGRTIRYQPIYLSGSTNAPISTNTVDGALISLSQVDSSGNQVIDINQSWKQLGLPQITTPPTFASLSELNSMIGGGVSNTNTEIISAGRTTGPKQGVCSLRLHLLTTSTNVKYNFQGSAPCGPSGGEYASFVDQMSVCRVSSGNTLCSYPGAPGDSGSAMFAQFGGQWKIIGILFAGGPGNPQTGQVSLGGTQPLCLANVPGCTPFNIGGVIYNVPPLFAFVNKITNLETALNISAWDGTPKPLIDPNSIQYVSVCGASFDKTLTCSGDTYWQMGLTNSLIAPCNP